VKRRQKTSLRANLSTPVDAQSATVISGAENQPVRRTTYKQKRAKLLQSDGIIVTK
jgi:hypothetical protein